MHVTQSSLMHTHMHNERKQQEHAQKGQNDTRDTVTWQIQTNYATHVDK